MSYRDELHHHLEAGARAIWTVTHEETRVLLEIAALAQAVAHNLYTWSAIRGVWDGPGRKQMISEEAGLIGALKYLDTVAPKPAIAVLLDPHESFDGPAKRAFRESLHTKEGALYVCLTPKKEIPLELQHEVYPLPFHLPTIDELAAILKRTLKISDLHATTLGESSAGLTVAESLVSVRLAINKHGKKMNDVAQEVWNFKAKQYDHSGLVVIRRPTDTFTDVGGCYDFKKWFKGRKGAFSPEARQKGIPVPRGILLVGAFGTGKTLISRAICNELDWCYIEWDLGKLLGPYVGTTEQNTDRLLEFTDLHRPCVVRIDEIGHQTSGFESSGYTDSGVVSRMLGKILTWMEERKDGVFFVASTNEPWKLPPHMVRAGRFDAIFSLTLPAEDALREILAIHLKKYCAELSLREGDIREITKKMEERGFSGAEVEQLVVEAVQTSFPDLPEYKSLLGLAYNIVPVSQTMSEQHQKLEKWAQGKARAA